MKEDIENNKPKLLVDHSALNMSEKKYALGVIVDGMAKGWQPVSSEVEAIKLAYDRSLEDTFTHCIMLGKDEDDENGQVVYLVVGGEFYKRHDL